MHIVEVILTKDAYEATEWRALILDIAKQVKGLRPITLHVRFSHNSIQVFMESKRDISALSSGVDGFLFRAVDEVPPNDQLGRKRMASVGLPAGGTILDIKEYFQVQKHLNLDSISLHIMRIGQRLSSVLVIDSHDQHQHYRMRQVLSLFPAHFFRLTLSNSQNYMFTSLPTYLSLEKTLHALQTQNFDAVFRVPGFPYSSSDYYLTLPSFQFDRHGLIVGASGSGKSRLIQLLIDRLARLGSAAEAYRVVVIDPHAALDADLQQIEGCRIVNLSQESAQLFPEAEADISAATELTTTLFQSLLAEQFNPRLERVLRFSVYVLLTAQTMNLGTLRQYLTDLDMRMQVLDHVKGFVPQNVLQFFATDFNEIRTQYYTEAVLPIVSLVDEMQLQPSLVGDAPQELSKTIKEHFLTVFSLNKVSMGEKAVKTVAGLLIQQIFLLAQARVVPYKLILIIDEVSVVQNPALAAMLAEARKFNLSVVLTQQYFSQIDSAVKESILSNVINYFVFRVSEDDAKVLAGNIAIELPAEIIKSGEAKGLKEDQIKTNILTTLSPRECVVRISANGQLLPCIKAVTTDIGADDQTSARIQDVRQPKAHTLPPKFERHAIKPPTPPTTPPVPVERAQNLLQSFRGPDPEDFAPPQTINIQQVLADQSSSRKDARKELTHHE